MSQPSTTQPRQVNVLLALWAIWGVDFGQGPKISSLDFIKKAVAAGFNLFNIGLFRGELHPEEKTAAEWDTYAAELADLGVKLQITPWMWDGGKSLQDNPEGWIGQLRASFPVIRTFHKRGVLLDVPGYRNQLRTDAGAAYEIGETWDQHMKNVDAIAPTLHDAAKLVNDEVGMNLTSEPENRFKCFSSPRRIETVVDAVGSPYYGTTSDSAHLQHIQVWGNGNADPAELAPNMRIATRRMVPFTKEWHLGGTSNRMVKAGGHIVTAPHELMVVGGDVDLEGFVKVAITEGGMQVVTIDHCMMDVLTLIANLAAQRQIAENLIKPYATPVFSAA